MLVWHKTDRLTSLWQTLLLCLTVPLSIHPKHHPNSTKPASTQERHSRQPRFSAESARFLSTHSQDNSLKDVFHRRSSSIKGHLPSKVVFHRRSSSIKGRLPSMYVFHQRSSSYKFLSDRSEHRIHPGDTTHHTDRVKCIARVPRLKIQFAKFRWGYFSSPIFHVSLLYCLLHWQNIVASGATWSEYQSILVGTALGTVYIITHIKTQKS